MPRFEPEADPKAVQDHRITRLRRHFDDCRIVSLVTGGDALGG
jgi:hypothetical protein